MWEGGRRSGSQERGTRGGRRPEFDEIVGRPPGWGLEEVKSKGMGKRMGKRMKLRPRSSISVCDRTRNRHCNLYYVSIAPPLARGRGCRSTRLRSRPMARLEANLATLVCVPCMHGRLILSPEISHSADASFHQPSGPVGITCLAQRAMSCMSTRFPPQWLWCF